MSKRVFNTVHGYIRSNEPILLSNTITALYVVPTEVIDLCLQFYSIGENEFECWNIPGQHMKIRGKYKQKLKKIEDHDGFDKYTNTSYGLQTINSMDKCIYTWTIKIYKSKSFWGHIGITDNFDCSSDSFAKYSGYSLWTPKLLQIPGIKSYSLITIELNLYERNVKFYVDGKLLNWKDAKLYSFYDESHENIEIGEDINYKLAFSCYKKGQVLSIIGFHRKFRYIAFV